MHMVRKAIVAMCVMLEGPFADSRGQGALLRLAPGEHVSHQRQQAIDERDCPQFAVAMVTTPSPLVSDRAFRRALVRFARCVRAHGVPDLALPRFGGTDPYEGLVFHLTWTDPRVVRAARSCVGPLRDL